jgi:hypothetical protein
MLPQVTRMFPAGLTDFWVVDMNERPLAQGQCTGVSSSALVLTFCESKSACNLTVWCNVVSTILR